MNVGIDLGTTYSLIARMEGNGKPSLLPDQVDHKELYTPSSVHVSQNTAFVGHLAEALAEQNPDAAIIRRFKRRFGDSDPVYKDRGTPWYAESIGALVLKKLRGDAETHGSDDVEGAVITVPAHFNDLQRKAVIAAASLADLKVLDLLEEPVAAALHYGVAQNSTDEVLVAYDFGGGTFDATVLSMNPRGVYVLAKDGLTDLGGKEIDDKVGAMILAQYERAGLSVGLNARTLSQLHRIAEEIKIELCMPTAKRVRRMVLLGGVPLEVEITRAAFENAITEIVEQTIAVMNRCIASAGLRPRDVTALLLVGGSSLAPLVEQRARGLFNAPGQRVLFHEPTKAVTFGAALRTTQLTGDARRYQVPPELRGVTGYNIGVRTIDPATRRVKIDTVVKKNMPLPSKARRTYYTHHADQTRIAIELVQFREPTETPVSLGQLTIGPIATPRPNYPVEVAIENCEDGTVSVQAYDPQTRVELTQVFSRNGSDPMGHLASQRTLVRSTMINNV